MTKLIANMSYASCYRETERISIPLLSKKNGDGRGGGGEEFILTNRKETYTCDNDGSNMVPAERRLVDLCKCKSSSLVGVLDVREVVVEVVKRRVSSRSLCSHLGGTCSEEALTLQSRGMVDKDHLRTRNTKQREDVPSSLGELARMLGGF